MKLSLMIFTFLLTVATANANCDKLFDRLAKEMGFVSWKDHPADVNKSSDVNMKKLSRTNKSGRRDPGPTLIMFKKEDHIKLKVLRSKDLNTKELDRDLYYTNLNCTQITEIRYSKGFVQHELNKDTCLEADLPVELSKRCDEIHIPLINKSESNSSESGTGVITQ